MTKDFYDISVGTMCLIADHVERAGNTELLRRVSMCKSGVRAYLAAPSMPTSPIVTDLGDLRTSLVAAEMYQQAFMCAEVMGMLVGHNMARAA